LTKANVPCFYYRIFLFSSSHLVSPFYALPSLTILMGILVN
jgi:hypothetical protein